MRDLVRFKVTDEEVIALWEEASDLYVDETPVFDELLRHEGIDRGSPRAMMICGFLQGLEVGFAEAAKIGGIGR